jgi:hypothetical protein
MALAVALARIYGKGIKPAAEDPQPFWFPSAPCMRNHAANLNHALLPGGPAGEAAILL